VVLRPTQHKIGHLRVVSPSQETGLGKQQQDTFNVKTETEKLNLTTKAHIRQSEEMYYKNTKN